MLYRIKNYFFLFLVVVVLSQPLQSKEIQNKNSSKGTPTINAQGGFIGFITSQKENIMGAALEADYTYAFFINKKFSIGAGGSILGALLTRPYYSQNILLFDFEVNAPFIFHVSSKVDLHLRTGVGLAFHLIVKATSVFNNNTLLTVGILWRTFWGITIKVNPRTGLTGESGYVGAYNSFDSQNPNLKNSYLLVHGFQVNAGIKFYFP